MQMTEAERRMYEARCKSFKMSVDRLNQRYTLSVHDDTRRLRFGITHTDYTKFREYAQAVVFRCGGDPMVVSTVMEDAIKVEPFFFTVMVDLDKFVDFLCVHGETVSDSDYGFAWLP